MTRPVDVVRVAEIESGGFSVRLEAGNNGHHRARSAAMRVTVIFLRAS